jgi:hypothetical protein
MGSRVERAWDRRPPRAFKRAPERPLHLNVASQSSTLIVTPNRIITLNEIGMVDRVLMSEEPLRKKE